MSGEDFALFTLAETTKKYVKTIQSDQPPFLDRETSVRNGYLNGGTLFHRKPLRFSEPKMTKLRNRLKKMNCFKTEEEEIIMMEMPRHKSIDIGVGFARRMSLFLFTKKTVCVHPYHPFTPAQSSRKFFMSNDD
ncbi:jg21385 [Pararge aegeria aegeria]|uniref:Jg21385 protein n=1 Tax=Pararge aegeria aegeria TaxID=348720 RepID=A0A8S4S0X1_9NEOP|nr:jg21385 [Pararge aegeria aegeria]